MRFHILRALMSPDPGVAGGGAGNAPAISDELVDAVVQKVSVQLQKALTSRDAQADKKREADQASFKKMIEEAISSRGGGGGNDLPLDNVGGGKGKDKDKDNVALQSLQKRLDEMAQRAEAFEQKASAERSQRRQVGLVQSVTQALGTLGITGERADAARDSLLYRNRITFADDESDEIIFRDDAGMATELALGLRQWAKTQSAQIFLPPTGVNGSGSRAGGKSPFDGKAPTKDQQLTTLAELFDRNMP